MNARNSESIPSEVKCACGCGRKFKPKYRWHIYFETKCRVRAFHERNLKNDKLKTLEKRIDELEKKLSQNAT